MSRNARYQVVLPDRPEAVFYPGEIIKGQLHIRSASSISNLLLMLSGEAKVVLRNFTGYKKVAVLTQTEVYLQTCLSVQNLNGLADSSGETQGTRAFEFQFLLPPGLPPTLRSPLGSQGRIKYRIALIEPRGQKGKKLLRKDIAVAPYLSLERNLSARDSVREELRGARHYLCCGTDRNIAVSIWLTKAGVQTGEVIPFHALIVNNSDGHVKSSYVTMTSHWVWRSIGQEMKGSERVKSFRKVSRGAIPPGGSMTWSQNDPSLVLPDDLVPTGPPGCTIMSVTHELCFTVVPQGLVKNMHLRLPLIVGSALPEEVRADVELNTLVIAALASRGLVG